MRPFVLISTLLTTLLQLAEINLRWSQRLLKKYLCGMPRQTSQISLSDWLTSLKEAPELANKKEEYQGTPPQKEERKKMSPYHALRNWENSAT